MKTTDQLYWNIISLNIMALTSMNDRYYKQKKILAQNGVKVGSCCAVAIVEEAFKLVNYRFVLSSYAFQSNEVKESLYTFLGNCMMVDCT